MSRIAEHPRADHVLFHLSDTHFVASDEGLYGTVDEGLRLRQLLEQARAVGYRPAAIVVTGDLADKGEPHAYDKLRAILDPFAAELGAPIVWVAGNHDDRGTLREHLLDEPPTADPFDRVHVFDGLRVIALDTTVPGRHYGELGDDQLDWLRAVLAEPAPFGTILAMHHPPVPCVIDFAVAVELRDQRRLAEVLAGTDVRAILGGHLHLSSFATFAGIPVSVASAGCYTHDLAAPAGGMRGRDAAQAFNYVHIYPDTVLHSVVPIDRGPDAGRGRTPEEAAELIAEAGIVIAPAARIPYVLRESRPAPETGGESVR